MRERGLSWHIAGSTGTSCAFLDSKIVRITTSGARKARHGRGQGFTILRDRIVCGCFTPPRANVRNIARREIIRPLSRSRLTRGRERNDDDGDDHDDNDDDRRNAF